MKTMNRNRHVGGIPVRWNRLSLLLHTQNLNSFMKIRIRSIGIAVLATAITALGLQLALGQTPKFELLKSFNPDGYPYGGVIQDSDGTLYGTTFGGGNAGYGTVFKLAPNGAGGYTHSVLKSYSGGSDGSNPRAAVILDSAGALYGVTIYGGSLNGGTVFKLTPDGASGYTHSVLKSFTGSDGCYPSAGVILDSGGALYGTTYQGGSGGSGGTVFKLTPDGAGGYTHSVLKSFTLWSSDGFAPSAGLILDSAGALYGTTEAGGSGGGGTVFKLTPDGADYIHSVLKSFSGLDGRRPLAGLIQDSTGALFSTTGEGGNKGRGTVFKLSPDGKDGYTHSVLKSFIADGCYPYAGLIQGTDGALYGTTKEGGSGGYGTVFKLKPDGSGFTVLKDDFDYSTTGGYLYAGLIQATDGAFYGTALLGGSGGSSGYGTVFKLNLIGTDFTVLESVLDDCTTGLYAGLMQAADSALYGTASAWWGSGYGSVFKLNLDGTGFTVLKNFDLSTTGGHLEAGLMQGMHGALYGTTIQGGSCGYGTVFKLNPDGTGFTVLKNFDHATTGAYLYGGLIQGVDGTLYGAAEQGGSRGYGTVFKLNPDGTGFTVLQNFDNSTTGAFPRGKLIRGTDGNLYGTTVQGGSGGYGTVFRLSVGSSPVVTLEPTNRLAVVGGNATFAVELSGVGPFSYQWRFGGMNLAGATDATLSLTDVQPAAAGSYECVIATAYGSVASQAALLTVVDAPGLVSYWPGDDNTLDVAGERHGTLHNGAGFAKGLVGPAFSLAGSGDYIDAPDTGLPRDSSPRTLEYWIKTGFNAQVPIVLGDTTGSSAFYVVIVYNLPYIGCWGGGDTPGTRPVDDGNWHHLALTFDGTTARLYVDGTLDAQAWSITAFRLLTWWTAQWRSAAIRPPVSSSP